MGANNERTTNKSATCSLVTHTHTHAHTPTLMEPAQWQSAAAKVALFATGVACSTWIYRKTHNAVNNFAPLPVPEERVPYVAKNLAKAAVLCALSPLAGSILWDVSHGTWNTTKIHLAGTVYASIDSSSLLNVRIASTTTILHHCSVVIFGACNLCANYSATSGPSQLMRAVVLNGIFSAFAFPVNLYLGARWFRPKNDAGINRLRVASAIVYAASLACNWYAQASVLMQLQTANPLLVALYGGATAIIVQDDIVLLKSLLCGPGSA